MSATSKTLMMAVLAFSLVAIPALGFAGPQSHGGAHGWGHGPGPVGGRLDAMAEELDLSAEQQALLETMKAAHEDFVDAEIGDSSPASRGERRAMRREHRDVMKPFHDAMRSDSPDFQAAGKAAKAEYSGENDTLFDAMIEAHVAFHASLTAEQLETLREFGPPQGFGPGRGRCHEDEDE